MDQLHYTQLRTITDLKVFKSDYEQKKNDHLNGGITWEALHLPHPMMPLQNYYIQTQHISYL